MISKDMPYQVVAVYPNSKKKSLMGATASKNDALHLARHISGQSSILVQVEDVFHSVDLKTGKKVKRVNALARYFRGNEYHAQVVPLPYLELLASKQ